MSIAGSDISFVFVPADGEYFGLRHFGRHYFGHRYWGIKAGGSLGSGSFTLPVLMRPLSIIGSDIAFEWIGTQNWILFTGFWRDTGEWDDTALWNDLAGFTMSVDKAEPLFTPSSITLTLADLTTVWILEGSSWNDAGYWNDSSLWQD
jgi:hypothetical protein